MGGVRRDVLKRQAEEEKAARDAQHGQGDQNPSEGPLVDVWPDSDALVTSMDSSAIVTKEGNPVRGHMGNREHNPFSRSSEDDCTTQHLHESQLFCPNCTFHQ